jgi:DNA repair protein RecO
MTESKAILLKRYPLGEHGVIAVMLTETAGLVRLAARGVHKSNNPTAGLLDLFYLTEVQWAESRKSNLHPMGSIRLISPYTGLRRDYNKLRLAAYFARLILTVVEEEAPVPELFDLMVRALNYLDQNSATLKALTHFERELVRLSGLYGSPLPAHITLKDQFGNLPLHLRDELVAQLPSS